MQKIIIASGPVIVEGNKVLLDQHGDTDFFKFCGGKVEENESLLETAHSRPREELGIDIEILDNNPFITFATKDISEGRFDVLLVHFLAKRIGEIKPGNDIREWDWFDIHNLPENIGPNIIPALKHFGFLK